MTIETLNATSPQYKHIIAFEISKAKLLVHVLPGGTTCEIANERTPIRALIKKEMRRNSKLAIGPLLVVCEATGSYDAHVLAAAVELGVDCHRAHGSRVRAFAKFRGTHAKSDPIDVRVIADYAASSSDLRLYEAPRPAQAALRELVAHRTDLRQMLEAEVARLEHARCAEVADSLRAHIRSLKALLEKSEAKINALIASDKPFKKASELMQSVKGVGPITAASVLAYMPEIGTVSAGKIAALAGLAPYDDDSGTFKGKRRIFGGRAEIRAVLYMAALSATRYNGHLHDLAERLKAKGKPYKVAATAVMRKILVILNAIVASEKPCKMANAT